ncbi:hypothetical protein VWY73_01730 [Phaeobacter sp. JH20_12]|uniref:hypothetical protein n=1 Tax=unclassified Phaeobacter TaxID=2621772 RepID=UPI003A877081
MTILVIYFIDDDHFGHYLNLNQGRIAMKNAPSESLISDGQLRAMAGNDPVTSLATCTDEELAAMARHMLPEMAGELLAYRLAEQLDTVARPRKAPTLLAGWLINKLPAHVVRQ